MKLRYLFQFVMYFTVTCIFFHLVVAFAASTDKVKEKAGETVDAAADYAHDTKQDFQKSLQKKLADLKIQIEKLQDKASKMSAKTRDSVNGELEKLEGRRTQIGRQLDDFSKESGRAWDKVRAGMSKAVNDLQTGVSQARKEIKSGSGGKNGGKVEAKKDGHETDKDAGKAE